MNDTFETYINSIVIKSLIVFTYLFDFAFEGRFSLSSDLQSFVSVFGTQGNRTSLAFTLGHKGASWDK
jgi:hypothetical protein